MLGLRDSGMGVLARATKLTDKEKRQVLAYIALDFHLHGINEVNDQVMYQLVLEALKKFNYQEDVERLLPALRERTGLLQGPGAWAFTHKTIGEFLVAELVYEGTTRLPDNRRLDRKELWAYRHDDAWTAILFFWAGKTTSRELEDFIGDLLNRSDAKEAILALSLLIDQGNRLGYQMQRTFALRILKKEIWGSTPNSSVCSTSLVPEFAYRELSSPAFNLRGLSTSDSSRAIMMLFASGILLPKDLADVDKQAYEPCLVALFWALGETNSCVDLGLRNLLDSLDRRDMALYCFNYQFDVSNLESSRAEVVLGKWMDAFPEGRPWVIILLLGAIWECYDGVVGQINPGHVKILVQLLVEMMDLPVDDEWLVGSSECLGWMQTDGIDIIEVTKKELMLKDSDWNLSTTHRDNLIKLCEKLMVRRSML
jgi:hypothetical protein